MKNTDSLKGPVSSTPSVTLYKGARNKTTNSNQNLPLRSPPNEKLHAPMRVGDLDKLDHHILILITEKTHERGIARLTKRPYATIQYRLNRLKKWDLIKPYYLQTALQKVKLYELTQKGAQILIHNEDVPPHTVIRAHAMTFAFPILEGNQPKSAQAYKMNNWTGYVFEFTNHVIRTTPKSIIVDVNLDLGADSIDNLNIKYYQFAQKYAVEFAEKHKIWVGSGQRSRNPDYAVMNIPIIQCVADRGNFRTPSGIKVDKSRSNGDLEFSQEQTARNFEFIMNNMPKEVMEIKADIKEIKKILTKNP